MKSNEHVVVVVVVVVVVMMWLWRWRGAASGFIMQGGLGRV
jgi:hypothetical protein